MKEKHINELKGKTITLFESSSEEAVITTSDGKRYRMYHGQDCCEQVGIEKIVGDPEALYGDPLVRADEEISHDVPDEESCTLTTFHLETASESLSIYWKGSSNGWYSESVYFVEL